MPISSIPKDANSRQLPASDWKQAKATSPSTFVGSILAPNTALRNFSNTISTLIQCYRTGVPFVDCLTIWQRLLVPNRAAKAIIQFVDKFANVAPVQTDSPPLLKTNQNLKSIDKTPLHHAVDADINIKDSNGMTPLHYTAHLKMIEATECLIQEGADSNILNDYGDTPYFIMQSHSEFIGTKAIKLAKQKDNGVTQEMMDRTLLAQRFGLLGASVLSDSLLNFALYTSLPTIKALQEATATYYYKMVESPGRIDYLLKHLPADSAQKVKSLDQQALKSILNKTVDTIANCLSNDIDAVMQRLSNGLPIAMAPSWPGSSKEVGHSVSLVIFGDKIALCNKSPSNGKKPGIWIYTIGNKQLLRHALEQCIPETTKAYFNQQIITDLDLRDPIHLPLKQQQVPNCAVANSNNIELAILFLLLLPQVGFKAASEIARLFKQDRVLDTKINMLKAYLKRHSKSQSFPIDLGLLGQIYDKCHEKPDSNRQITTLIKEWATKHRINLKAISTLGTLQAFLGAYMSVTPNSTLLQRGYEAKTGDTKVDTEMYNLIDRWAKFHNVEIRGGSTVTSERVSISPTVGRASSS
ncbi:MAG: ankyrin repeat domain-containing protein [Nitrosomonas sp.]|nr:MAG: ankyrin repeat domain-containing protein [Nitrosomonas sp.]